MTDKIIQVGVGVFVLKEGKFLIGQRNGSHGKGQWGLPGGHVEFGETFEQAAYREVLEETGLEVMNLHFAAVTNDFFEEENRQSVVIWMLSDWKSGVEEITEPDKCAQWIWSDVDTLPSPLFTPWKNLLESHFIDSIREEIKDSYFYDRLR